ncbi:ATP-binding protein [Pseudomonas sp. Marseille-QA0892]
MASNAPKQLSVAAEEYRDTCEIHGEFTGRITRILGREFKSGCQQCAEIRQREAEEAKREAEVREQRAKLSRKLGSAMIPPRFAEKTFENYTAKTDRQIAAMSRCKQYAEGFREHYDAGRCLMLLGRPGTGKTHLAAAIANHLLHNTPAMAVYRTLGGILQHIKGSYDRASEYSEADALESLTSPHLLIIDEIGATKTTEFEQATLFTIINTRYENMLPTVIVSNLPPKELPNAMGERCVDRMREGGGIVVGFDWESARGLV